MKTAQKKNSYLQLKQAKN